MYLKKDWFLKLIFSIAYLLTLILKFSAKKKSFQFHRIIYDLCLIFVEYGVAHSLYKLAQERHKFHKNALPYWSGFRIDRGHKIYPFGLFYHHYNTDKNFHSIFMNVMCFDSLIREAMYRSMSKRIHDLFSVCFSLNDFIIKFKSKKVNRKYLTFARAYLMNNLCFFLSFYVKIVFLLFLYHDFFNFISI